MSTHTNAIASSSKPPKSKDPKDPSRKKSKKSKTINADGGAVPDAMGSSVAVDGATPIPPPTSKKHKHSKKDKSGHGGSAKGPFQHQRSNMRMSIAPKFSADQLVGVREALDGLVMRYVPQLQGVLLAHWDHTFQDDTVQLISECPFGIAEVEFDSIIWAPKIGQKLYGTHSLSSPSHLSLLFNKTFNISIPLQHIPLDQYEFEATDPADLDADADADDTDSEDEDEAEELGLRGLTGFGMAKGVEEVGRWKVKSTGKLVGEGGKGVKFTVIGMQVTNQMLSLTGSLLSDPSDPPALSSLHVPSSSSASATAAARARVDSPTPEPPSFPSSSQRPTKRPANASTKAQAKANAKAIITDKTPVAPSTSAPAPSSAKKATTAPATAAAPAIDPQYLSARDQKKLRKEEEKRKRDARKERKGQVPGQAEGEEGLDLEGTVAQGGEASVSMDGREEQVQVQLQQGTKRKMEGEEGRKKKKERKE